MKNNILQCVDNYNKTLDNNPLDVYCGYIGVMNEYIIHHLDTINSNESKNISLEKMRNYLIVGVQCLTHVFKMLLLYSKNLNLTIYHSQRAFYFCVEFMEQLSDEMHNFLQLTSKDACLFVYKKTIYELNNDYRTNYNSESCINETIISNVISFYSNQLINIINNNSDHIGIIRIMNGELSKIIQQLNKYYHKQESLFIFNKKLVELNDYVYCNSVKNNDYSQLEKYMKQFKKN